MCWGLCQLRYKYRNIKKSLWFLIETFFKKLNHYYMYRKCGGRNTPIQTEGIPQHITSIINTTVCSCSVCWLGYSQLSTNLKVTGLIPSSGCPHFEVSLSKALNLKLLPMLACTLHGSCVSIGVWVWVNIKLVKCFVDLSKGKKVLYKCSPFFPLSNVGRSHFACC